MRFSLFIIVFFELCHWVGRWQSGHCGQPHGYPPWWIETRSTTLRSHHGATKIASEVWKATGVFDGSYARAQSKRRSV